MNTLPLESFTLNITESEAYDLIMFNWKHGKIRQACNYQVKEVKELQRINYLGLVLNIKAPAWKENELYKLIENQWDFFTNLGTEKDFTPKLSYKAIVYILQLYKFPLKQDTSKQPKVAINRVSTTKFKYTEDQSLAILKNNKSALEESSGFSIYELTNTPALIKVLKTNQTALYRLLKSNMAELELLGCSKTNKYNITYRGVLFLLLNQKYPLDLKLDTDKPKVVYLTTKKESIKNNVSPEGKPDIELIKSFFAKRRDELRDQATLDRAKADDSYEKLTIANDAYWHLEQAEDCLSLL